MGWRKKMAWAALPVLLVVPLAGCSFASDGGERGFDDIAREVAWNTACETVDQAFDSASNFVGDMVAAGGKALTGLADVRDGALAASNASDAMERLLGKEGRPDSSLAAKAAAITVSDARDGSKIAVVSDGERLCRAVPSAADADIWRIVGSNPGFDRREYVFSYHQSETVKLGQDPAEVNRCKMLDITTYRGSNCVTAEIEGFPLRFDLAAPPAYVEALRSLAE